MCRKTIALSVVLSLSLCFSLIIFLTQNKAENISRYKAELLTAESKLSEEIKNLAAMVTVLVDERQQLLDQIEDLDIRLNKLAANFEVSQSSRLTNSSKKEKPKEIDIKDEQNGELNLHDRFAQKMMQEKNYDPVKVIEHSFSEQKIDFLWASTYESKLTELFASSNLVSLPVESLSCKESICKVSIYAEGIDTFSTANLLASSLATQSWRDPDASFIFNNDTSDGLLNFYIGKDKNSLEF